MFHSSPIPVENAMRLAARRGILPRQISFGRRPAAQVLNLRLFEHRRCGNNIAQGNALGFHENSGIFALKEQDKCRQFGLFRPCRALLDCPITQGVALGYNVSAPSVLKRRNSKSASKVFTVLAACLRCELG